MRRNMEAATSQGASPSIEPPLAALMQRAGLVDPGRLEHALAESESAGKRLPDVLLTRGWVDEIELARFLAEQRRMPFVALEGRNLDLSAARILPEAVARLNHAVPVGFRGDLPVVVIEDPTDDNAFAAVRGAIQGDALFGVSTRSAIAATLDAAYARPQEFEFEPLPTPDPEPAPEPALAPVPEPATESEPEPFAELAPEPPPARPVPEPESDPFVELAPEPAPAPPAPVPVVESAPAPVPAPASTPAPEPESEQAPAPAPVPAPAAPPAPAPESEQAPTPAGAPTAVYEVVVRLSTGEAVAAEAFVAEADAKNRATELMRTVAAESGDWPFVGKRYLRPDLVVSVDVVECPLRAAGGAPA